MTRWTEADLERYQARTVGPTGKVSKQSVPIVSRVSTPLRRYTAKREWHDGVRYGSQRELARYKDLRLMQDAGAIGDLKIHPRYDLHVLGIKLGFIELDFEYLDHASGKRVYEDVKDPKKNSSTRTPIYRWKARHLKAEYGIEVTEVF